MVSSDYFNRHDEWWFDTEEAARKKRAELLATLDMRWEVRMQAVKSDRTCGTRDLRTPARGITSIL